MIDKFIQLTRKILKVLSVDCSMKSVKYSSLGTGEVMRIIYDSPDLNFYAIMEIHETSRPYNGTSLIVVSVYTVEAADSHEDTPLDYHYEALNLVKPYMDIIYSIFNLNIQHSQGYGTYLDISVNDTNNKILDELLNYTDEEFKLYINLL